MVIIGVDPGCSGSLVAVDYKTGDFVGHLIMPTIKVGSKTRVDAASIKHWLNELPTIHHAYIEQVGAMPKQGVSSMFTFGHAVGTVVGVIVGSGIPVTFLTPQSWKKTAGLIGSEKDAARSRAIQLYPNLKELSAIGKGQAIADALLIARHGRLGGKRDLI